MHLKWAFKLLAFIVISLVIINISGFFFNDGAVKSTIEDLSLRKYYAIKNLQPAEYDDIVLKKELKEYYNLRDQFNIEYFKRTEKRFTGFTYNEGNYTTRFFFNWCLIKCKSSCDLVDYDSLSKNGIKYENIHIFLLNKQKGKWFIINDIYTNDGEPSYFNMLNSQYNKLRVKKLKKDLEDIKIKEL